MRPISIAFFLNSYFHPQIVVFKRFFEVRVLRALKGVTEGPSSNSSKFFMRPISFPHIDTVTLFLEGLLCSQGFLK